jgi:hypothetical protein
MGIVFLDCCLYNPLDPWIERKQQVGECWVCVIFFACVFVGAPDMTTASDDPSSSDFCLMCIGCFPGGGASMPPPGYAHFPNFFFGGTFCYFLAIL